MLPSDLKDMYRQSRLIPFVGAGASMSVKWEGRDGDALRGLSWSELVDEAIRLLNVAPAELLRTRGGDLQILEYFALVNGRFMLTNWLNRRMDPTEAALRAAPIHRALCNLEKCRVFYTTNYDNFIERAFELHGREVRTVAIEAHMGRRDSVAEVVKFHGDFNHPDGMVLTESDYERRLRLGSPMDYRLQADLLGSGFLFIGYSFSDPNVSYIFRLINDLFKKLPVTPTGHRGYVVVADPSDFEKRLFRARNLEIVAVSRKTFTEDTVRILEELRT